MYTLQALPPSFEMTETAPYFTDITRLNTRNIYSKVNIRRCQDCGGTCWFMRECVWCLCIYSFSTQNASSCVSDKPVWMLPCPRCTKQSRPTWFFFNAGWIKLVWCYSSLWTSIKLLNPKKSVKTKNKHAKNTGSSSKQNKKQSLVLPQNKKQNKSKRNKEQNKTSHWCCLKKTTKRQQQQQKQNKTNK